MYFSKKFILMLLNTVIIFVNIISNNNRYHNSHYDIYVYDYSPSIEVVQGVHIVVVAVVLRVVVVGLGFFQIYYLQYLCLNLITLVKPFLMLHLQQHLYHLFVFLHFLFFLMLLFWLYVCNVLRLPFPID